MKSHRLLGMMRAEGELIATFGTARLVKQLTGKIELLGGSPEDRSAAREWCSLFLDEGVDVGRLCVS